MSTEEKYVDETIDSHEVVVWGKSYCPYTKKTKALFDKLNVEYYAIELDKVDNGDKLQAVLKAKTGQSSVPNVWIKKQFIGGCDDTHAKEKDGSLQKLLASGTESATPVPVLTAEDLEDSEDGDDALESHQVSRARGISTLETAELPTSELDAINTKYRHGKELTKEDLEDSDDGGGDPEESFKVSRNRGVSALQTAELDESELDTINTQYRHGMGSIAEKVFTKEDLEESEDNDDDPVESFKVSRTRGISTLETGELSVSELDNINKQYRQGIQATTETGNEEKKK